MMSCLMPFCVAGLTAAEPPASPAVPEGGREAEDCVEGSDADVEDR